MLAQPESSRTAEAAVINGFNAKLAAKASSFAAANSGVSDFGVVVQIWVY
jgi:hypothetical protein